MSLRINNNVEAFNAHRQLVATSDRASKSMERLSSGYRINRAADDAAGLAISEKLRGQIEPLEHGIRIKAVETKYESFGVDTPEDLEQVRRLLTTTTSS